jgi:hypothetical protein
MSKCAGNIGTVWIMSLASLTNIGKPNFWRPILPPTSDQRVGVETWWSDQKIGRVAGLWR